MFALTVVIEWPLLGVYGSALAITLAGIVYAFVLHAQGDIIAYGGLALAWSLYNAVILTIVVAMGLRRRRSPGCPHIRPHHDPATPRA